MDERKVTIVTIWLGALTGAVVVLIIGAIVGLAALSSDVAQLDEQVTALKYGAAENGLPPVSAPSTSAPSTVAFKAQIDDVRLTSKALSVTLTIRWAGPADLLYLPPVVRDGQGKDYLVTAASLKVARLAWLEMTTSGQATMAFVFEPAPPAKGALTLVFNPTLPVGDAVAPRVDVILRAGE